MSGSPRLRGVAVERARRLLVSRQGRRAELRVDPIPGLDALDTYLIGTHATLTSREQAAQLDVSPHAVLHWRRSLQARGLISPLERASHAPITEAEIAAVARLARAGWSRARIAESRGINKERVGYCLRRAGLVGSIVSPLVTTPQLMRLLGMSTPESLRRLIRRGWLPDAWASVARPGGRRGWGRDEILDFLRLRAAWVAYEPGQIRDAELQRFARAQREAAGGRWWTYSQILHVLPIQVDTLGKWMRAGFLGGRPREAWGSERFVWLTTGDAAALEGLSEPLRAAGRGDRYAIARVTTHLRPRLFAALGGQL